MTTFDLSGLVQLDPNSNGTGVIQYDTISNSGTYAITADGAQGGNGGGAPERSGSGGGGGAGGFGAQVSGDIYLAAGTVLEIVEGRQGATTRFDGGAGGGGGGSFVIETNDGTTSVDTILAVAGGGGGGGGIGRFGGVGGAGGAGGESGGSHRGTAGGGGGKGGGAPPGAPGGGDGQGPSGGFLGGTGHGSDLDANGGFGGGGGGGFGDAARDVFGGGGGGGGGGGYAGGGGGSGGGFSGGGGGGVGGSSYLNPSFTDASKTAGTHPGDGSVSIGAASVTAASGNTTLFGAMSNADSILTGGPGSNILVAGYGASTLIGGAGNAQEFARGSEPVLMIGADGNTIINGDTGTGPETIFSGESTSFIALNNAAGTVVGGSGAATVLGGSGQDVYGFINGYAGGAETIGGFKATDILVFAGYGAAPIVSEAAYFGSDIITLTDGTQITLEGIDHKVFS